jgi:hypothetical protein
MKPWSAEKHSAGAVYLFLVDLSLLVPSSEFFVLSSGAKIRLTQNSFCSEINAPLIPKASRFAIFCSLFASMVCNPKVVNVIEDSNLGTGYGKLPKFPARTGEELGRIGNME